MESGPLLAASSDLDRTCNGQRPASKTLSRKILFVGNSHTYQPKELGGVPNAVARLAAAMSGAELSVESVTKGGADLLDLWEDFSATTHGSSSSSAWDTFVLQVGYGADKSKEFAVVEALKHRYAPLLLELQPSCTVLLYQTWSGPRPSSAEGDLLAESLEEYRAALLLAGIRDVRVARAGHAFLAVQEASARLNERIYPALWKDDMGHGSALAGVLVAAIMVLSLGLGATLEGRQRPLGKILEAMLPNAWRTASPGFAGDVNVAQKGWRDECRGAPAAVMELLQEEDLPLNRYPPGMRTERRDLGFDFGDVLAAVAAEAVKPLGAGSGDDAQDGPVVSENQPKPRRWQGAGDLQSCPASLSTPPGNNEQSQKSRRWQKR